MNIPYKSKSTYLLVLLTGLFYTVLSCNSKNETPSAKEEVYVSESDRALLQAANNFFAPLPEVAANPENVVTDDKVLLGKMLYYEPRLSKSSWISCNSCHNIATYGADNLPTSLGHQWNVGPRNAPTTLNAALHFAQFWDGRAKDVEEQAQGPILNPGEMAAPHAEFAVDRIASMPEYVELFNNAFPGDTNAVTYVNIANAIAAFERRLMTPSRFDQFLNGKVNALSDREKSGLQTFIDVGCIQCHTTATVGGTSYQKVGVYQPYWELTGSKIHDEGRFEVTQVEEDKYFFKVPSLLNVTQTYPYFHDGSVWDLNKVIEYMAEMQLNKKLNEVEVFQIAAFLGSLTGEIPAFARELPILPASTDKTERPSFD